MDIDPSFTFKKSLITEIMVIIGILGNIISFVVFARKTFRKNPVSIYCCALALFDVISLSFSSVMDFYYILYNNFIRSNSDAICASFGYGYFAFSSIPSWILVAFSIERTLNLKKVTNAKKKLAVHFSIVLAIILSHLLLYIEIPIYLRLFPRKVNNITLYACEPTTLSFGNAMNVVYNIESSALPFLIMIISSLITIKMLRDSRRQVEMMGSVAEKRKSRDRKFAITSITFNVLFIVLKMPYLVCISIGFYYVNYYVYQVSYAMFFLNFSINFFVHFFSNSIFRKELTVIVKIRKPSSDSTTRPNLTNRSNK